MMAINIITTVSMYFARNLVFFTYTIMIAYQSEDIVEHNSWVGDDDDDHE